MLRTLARLCHMEGRQTARANTKSVPGEFVESRSALRQFCRRFECLQEYAGMLPLHAAKLSQRRSCTRMTSLDGDQLREGKDRWKDTEEGCFDAGDYCFARAFRCVAWLNDCHTSVF